MRYKKSDIIIIKHTNKGIYTDPKHLSHLLKVESTTIYYDYITGAWALLEIIPFIADPTVDNQNFTMWFYPIAIISVYMLYMILHL